jgi:hypothetical protein
VRGFVSRFCERGLCVRLLCEALFQGFAATPAKRASEQGFMEGGVRERCGVKGIGVDPCAEVCVKGFIENEK